jgi:ferredoxin--NADP+ reductase
MRMGTEDGVDIMFDPDVVAKCQSTGDLQGRLNGKSYTPPGGVNAYYYGGAGPILPTKVGEKQQALGFLEDLPIKERLVSMKDNAVATVMGSGSCIGDAAPGTISHIILKLPPAFKYVEGQSVSVVPRGVDEKGKPHKPRLYSIASTRYGDLGDGNTLSLCVRLAEYTDPATGKTDDSKVGVCSSQLCSAKPGDEFLISGPVGKSMVLPVDPSQDIIMVATGTGVAPFRAFCHRLFMEPTPAAHTYTGNAWMFLGVPVSDGLLYPEEFQAMEENSEGRLKLTYAISREQTNAKGGRMYVQDQLAANGEEIFSRIEKGASIYFCGLKGMMPGIMDAMEGVAKSKGMAWESKLEEWRSKGKWHVEVY